MARFPVSRGIGASHLEPIPVESPVAQPTSGDQRVIFQDTITVDAPAAKVWDFLLDVNRSAALVPGVEQIILVDDRTFDGVIEARVGPIAGKFEFRAHIVDS